jgi:hypothetical protein
MATEEELYVSVSRDNYRANKSSLLMSQVFLLETLKKMNNLKVLNRQKNDLKKQFYKLLTVIQSDIKTLQEKTPTPKIPKTVQIQIEEKEVPGFPAKKPAKKDNIEEELMLIQEKLRELNA